MSNLLTHGVHSNAIGLVRPLRVLHIFLFSSTTSVVDKVNNRVSALIDVDLFLMLLNAIFDRRYRQLWFVLGYRKFAVI